MTGPVLVDTMCWRRHLNRGGPDAQLEELLGQARAVTHEWVRLELVMGGISPRARAALFGLTCLPAITADLELAFIERERLAQRGLSVVDVQILHAAVTTGTGLYTLERAIQVAYRDIVGRAPFGLDG